MPQSPYLSTDPHAGAPVAAAGGYLSTDPNAGHPAAAAPTGGLEGFGREFWQRANPIAWAQGLLEAAKKPLGTAVSIVSADPKFLTEAHAAAKNGDYATAGRKVLSYLSMGLGHDLDAQADLMAQGRFAEGAGAMAGTAAQFLAPEAAAKVALPAVKVAASGMKPPNPAVADAVALAKREGVPLDGALATDNAAVRAVQHISDRTLGGAQVAGRAAQRQAEGLATVGERLAAKAHPTPVTMEQAGQAVRDGVMGSVRRSAADADTAYGTLRQIEADPKNTRSVQVGTTKDPQTGAVTPVMKDVALPVNIAATRTALKPLYDGLMRERELNGVMMGDKSRALNALDKLMTAPDHAPLSLVDAALSDLKSFARSDVPELRSTGQGVAAQAVKELDARVRGAAAQAGPGAVKALEDGRAATIAKHAAADVLESLNAEPVRTVRGATGPRDATIVQLRQVAQQAPAALPQIGRAVLDDFLGKATEGGGFAHADKLYADWQKLGPETKRMLFKDPGYVKDLDSFFLLAKQAAKNANPSGTAHTVAALAQGSTLFEPMVFASTVVGGAGVSAFLHSPAGVRILTEGLKLPRSQAAQAVWMSKVRKFGAAQGSVLAAQPAK
jgi:hypothetical protein